VELAWRVHGVGCHRLWRYRIDLAPAGWQPEHKSANLVISADPSSDARSRALRLGANAYFGKPYSIVSLCHKVEQLLDSKTKTTSA
jgi:hypothetical protein